jgi:ribosomal protein L37AE/L43A
VKESRVQETITMPDPPCPACKSTHVIFLKKSQVYKCGDCEHEFPAVDAGKESIQVKSTHRQRIFLSYGHDANAELVKMICTDLRSRAHDVWIDKDGIKSGDDWRERITAGIKESNKVVSFLSKHSTRDPGVCLDEIAIAIGEKHGNIQTILVESETEVKPPSSISHIQWLDMRDWKERKAADGKAWTDWYAAKLAEIVRVVESEESVRFAGEIEQLQKLLKPISSEARVIELVRRKFTGREWLAAAVEAWRVRKDDPSRLFWLVGGPGIGKSAFAAHIAHHDKHKVVAL